MRVDVGDLRTFYGTPLGELAQRHVGRTVTGWWPRLDGLGVLGLGYATPYLELLSGKPVRRLSFMPAAQGVTVWPERGPTASTLVDPLMLPLPDGSLDRVLVVHALETVESPTELLHEIWRVLHPGGRLILVCPNRRGLWARMDTTPFGNGQPYSRSQLRRLLRETWYSAEGWAEVLYSPPLRSRLLLRGAAMWERLGVGLSLPFAGLHVVEATKQLQRPVPIKARQRRTRLSPVLLPAPVAPSPG